MFQKIKTIEKSKVIIGNSNFLLYKKIEENIILEGIDGVFETSENLPYINLFNDYILLNNTNTKQLVVVKDCKIYKRIENTTFFTTKNDLLILRRRENKDRLLDFYDINLNCFKTIKLRVGHPYLVNDFFIFSGFLKGRTLNFLNLKTFGVNTISFAEETWFSTDKDDTNEYEGEIFQIVGKWSNLLLVHIGRYRLIAIDLTTQQEVWRIENFLGELSFDKAIHLEGGIKTMCDILLDTRKDKAYVFVMEHLLEIDLHTKTTKKIKDYKTPNFHWNIEHVKLYDDVITFSAADYIKFPSHFGVIDRETKEILWSTKCKGGRYLTTAPQLHNNKLYISDSENTLYIYEKEEVVS